MADYDRDATNAALRKLGYSTPEDLMSSPDDSALGGVAPATTTSAVPPDNFDLREPYENPAVEDPTGAPLGSVASTKTEEPVAAPPAAEPAPEPEPTPAPEPATESTQPAPATESTQPSRDNNFGALEPGSLDLTRRPFVRNEDGSTSTVRSMGVNLGGKEYLIPTVSEDGRVMGDDEAVDYFRKTGKHLGVYASPEASTAAGDAIHLDQVAHPPQNSLPPTEAGPPAPPPKPGAVHPAVEAPPQATPSAPGAVTVTIGQPAPAAPAAAAPKVAQAGGSAISRLKSDIQETVGNEQEIAARQAALQDETAAGRENIGEQRNQANQAAIGQSVERETARKAMFEKRRGEMESELTTLKNKIANPPTDIMGIVTTLAAGIAAARGRPEIGAAFQSVGKLLNKRMQRYAGEIEAGKTNIEGLGKLINVDHLGSVDETEQQSLINKAVNAEMLSAVDTLTKSSANREDANKYRMVGEEIRKKALEQELQIRQRAQAAAAAKGKTLAQKAADDRMHRAIFASDDPAVQLKVAKSFGVDGDRVLKTGLAPRAEMLNQEKDVAGIDASRAAADKSRRSTEGEGRAGGDEIVGGYRVDPERAEVWNGLEKSTKAKYVEGAKKVPTLMKTLDKMEALVKSHGSEYWGPVAGEMNTLHGAGQGIAKDTEELGALDKGVEAFWNSMVPNPTSADAAITSKATLLKKIQTARQHFQQQADDISVSMGLTPPVRTNLVEVRDTATGKTMKVDAAQVAASEKVAPGRLVPVE